MVLRSRTREPGTRRERTTRKEADTTEASAHRHVRGLRDGGCIRGACCRWCGVWDGGTGCRNGMLDIEVRYRTYGVSNRSTENQCDSQGKSRDTHIGSSSKPSSHQLRRLWRLWLWCDCGVTRLRRINKYRAQTGSEGRYPPPLLAGLSEKECRGACRICQVQILRASATPGRLAVFER